MIGHSLERMGEQSGGTRASTSSFIRGAGSLTKACVFYTAVAHQSHATHSVTHSGPLHSGVRQVCWRTLDPSSA